MAKSPYIRSRISPYLQAYPDGHGVISWQIGSRLRLEKLWKEGTPPRTRSDIRITDGHYLDNYVSATTAQIVDIADQVTILHNYPSAYFYSQKRADDVLKEILKKSQSFILWVFVRGVSCVPLFEGICLRVSF
jgi:hypothetical protein